jgi:hypothetical protein
MRLFSTKFQLLWLKNLVQKQYQVGLCHKMKIFIRGQNQTVLSVQTMLGFNNILAAFSLRKSIIKSLLASVRALIYKNVF